MHLFRLHLNMRLGLGVGLLVLLGLGVAGFGVFQLVGVGRQVARMTVVADDMRRILAVEGLLNSVRESETRFRLNGEPGAVDARRQAERRIASLLSGAGRLAETNGSGTSSLGTNTLRAGLAAHDESFDTLVGFSRTAAGARAALLSGGAQLTDRTKALVTAARALNNQAASDAASAVERTVLLVRVASWRFLATTAPDGPGAFASTVDDAAEALSDLDGATNSALKRLGDPVSDSLDTYKDEFDSYADAVLSMTEFYRDKLLPQIVAMQSGAATVERSLTGQFQVGSRDGTAIVRRALILQAILAAIVLCAGTVLASSIALSVVRPLRRVTDMLARLAKGEIAAPVSGQDRSDEIGDIARAAEIFRRTAIQREELAQAAESERQARDRRSNALASAVEAFRAEIEGVAGALSAASDDLEITARQMSSNAADTSEEVRSVTIAAERASSGVEVATVAAGQLTSSIGDISRQLGDAARMTERASAEARRTDGIVHALADSSRQISQVVGVIDAIAARTNLLALNATIEAARAGDAGRGFAVVATEVKDLARQTMNATGDVNGRIAQVQEASREAVAAIETIAAIVRDVSAITVAMSAAIEQQDAATGEIARNVGRTAESASEVRSSIVSVSAAAGATGNAASQVLEAAGQMSRRAGQLTGQVDRLVDAVRAA